MSHTKGKWSWNMAEDGVATLYGGTKERPAAIADFWRKPLRLKNGATTRDTTLRAEQIANVTLCVNAPRMQAALLWVLGYVETMDPNEEADIDRIHDAVAWGLGKVDIRNAVLRKALTAKLEGK